MWKNWKVFDEGVEPSFDEGLEADMRLEYLPFAVAHATMSNAAFISPWQGAQEQPRSQQYEKDYKPCGM